MRQGDTTLPPAKRGRTRELDVFPLCAHFRSPRPRRRPLPGNVLLYLHFLIARSIENHMAEKLKIIPLGGLNEIGKNFTPY